MIQALYFVSFVTVALAWTLAIRMREHRPVATLLTVGLGVDLARRALRTFYILPVVRPLRGHTLSGWPLAGAHLNDALFLVWPAAIAACAMVVFLKRRPWPAIAVYAIVVTSMVVLHPTESSGALPKVLIGVQLAGLAASLGFAATWYSRSDAPTTTAQASLVIILAGELATLVGSWRIGVFDSWNVSQVLYLLLYVVLNIMQGGFLWQSRSR